MACLQPVACTASTNSVHFRSQMLHPLLSQSARYRCESAQQKKCDYPPPCMCHTRVLIVQDCAPPPLSLFLSFKRLSLFSPAINIISARWCSPCSPLPLPPVRLAGLSATGFHKKFPFLSLPRRRRRRLRKRKKREVEEGYFPPPFVPLPPQVTLKCRLPPFPSLSL